MYFTELSLYVCFTYAMRNNIYYLYFNIDYISDEK